MNFFKKILGTNPSQHNGGREAEEKISLEISGMSCDHCASTIEHLLEKKKGILSTMVSFPNRKGEITYDPKQISKEEIIQSINQTANYHATEAERQQ